MAKMWKKIRNVILIVVLIALIGGIDVLFGCCAEQENDINVLAEPISNVDKVEQLDISAEKNDVTDSGPLGRIRGYMPKTKMDIFNTCLVGLVVVFGFSLFVSMVSTGAKKGNIVQRAEKLEESLQNPYDYNRDKLSMVSDMLCKPLSNSTEVPPLNASATTQFNDQFNNIQLNTTQYNSNQDYTTEEPMTTNDMTTEDPSYDICKDLGVDIYYILYPHVPNFYETTVGEKEIGSVFSIVKGKIREAAEFNCGNGFFELKGKHNNQKVYFSGKNEIVKDAINDATCQRAAVTFFRHLKVQLPNHVVGANLRYTFPDSAFVTTKMRAAVRMARGKSCGDEFLYYRADGSRWRITYDAVNPHISRGVVRFKEEQACQKVADDVVLILQSRDSLFKGENPGKSLYDTYQLKEELLSAAEVLESNDCGNDFFNISRHERNDRTIVTWNNNNNYIIEATKKAEAKSSCMTAAKEVVNHLSNIGLYSRRESDTLLIPDIADDIELLIRKTKAVGSSECGDEFFEVRKNNDDKFVLAFDYDNIYVKLAMLSVNTNSQCKLTARGVLRRLVDYGLHTTNERNKIEVTGPSWLITELRGKIDRTSRVYCKVGTPTYALTPNGIEVSYGEHNRDIKNQQAKIREDIWCPKETFAYSSILDSNGHDIDGNSTSVSVTLSNEEKNLVNTARTQLYGINCGNGFKLPVVDENEAAFSWNSNNNALRKIWNDARTSLEPLV